MYEDRNRNDEPSEVLTAASDPHTPPLGDLDEFGHESGVEPSDGVAASLQSALVALRERADGVAATSATKGDAKVTAAEEVADAAAELDEQIGAIARRDEA